MSKSKSHGRRFTVLQRQKMRSLFQEGYALSFIARKFDCRPVAVWNNVFDLSPATCFSPIKSKWAMNTARISIANVKKIRARVLKGIKSTEASQLYGISESAALGIIKGKTFRWVPGWTRPYAETFVYLQPMDLPEPERKTDKVRGAKLGSAWSVKKGELIRLAKKHNVSTSTICRWKKKGKL